ncbi:hypothetical protein E3E23_09195 [Thermococcus sp. CX2]|uniref:hypothetical protein n=1 Tax=Thermococcus sp. CX2 TaxID=163006 RepID=UPI00143A6CFE|nr:hypothetical protein [Thermococcus sp. CX2]NJE85996.1 hypothetical protein [Thermococcus sp. CX2]
MGRILGSILLAAGIVLWYYGGASGITFLVNLGIGAIILGLVVAALPSRGQVDREALFLTCESSCEFFKKFRKDLELKGDPVVIPPYENLPKGGIFLPKSENFSLSLGKFDEKTVFVTGTEEESGILISPPAGWALVEYFEDNAGELSGTGLGYASSAVSSGLSALGLGSAEVFETEDGKIGVFIRPLCAGPVYADPVCSAVLLGVAMGTGEVLRVESAEKVKDHVRITLERLGGIERWL